MVLRSEKIRREVEEVEPGGHGEDQIIGNENRQTAQPGHGLAVDLSLLRQIHGAKPSGKRSHQGRERQGAQRSCDKDDRVLQHVSFNSPIG